MDQASARTRSARRSAAFTVGWQPVSQTFNLAAIGKPTIQGSVSFYRNDSNALRHSFSVWDVGPSLKMSWTF